MILAAPTLYIQPFESVGPLRFGMTAKEAEQVAGEPILVRKNPFGETDYRYFGLSIRLSSREMRIVEVGMCVPTDVRFDGIHILRSRTALKDLCERDGKPFKCAGFIILPNLGFALKGFQPRDPCERILTVFALDRWDYVRHRNIRRYRRF